VKQRTGSDGCVPNPDPDAEIVRKRGDLSMAEALSLVAEVFNADE
jgi:hypothetical protein